MSDDRDLVLFERVERTFRCETPSYTIRTRINRSYFIVGLWPV